MDEGTRGGERERGRGRERNFNGRRKINSSSAP